MKILLSLVIALVLAETTYGQKAYLDVEKYASCELFMQKSGYDWQQRLLQIDSLENQLVTVFEIKGNDHQIKTSYTGKVFITGKKDGKLPTKGQATVITVVEDLGDGKMSAHFPLTNDKNYKIYLKSCLNNN